MDSEVLISVDNISKKYCRAMKKSMIYGIQDILSDVFQFKVELNNLRDGEFWSLNEVNFEVRRGECLGVVGPNGAGKSTLLKLLNGIFLPDQGRITVKGKVGALIEVGAGFHPMLTGRENIYLNGTILGMEKSYIDECFDSIVEFSELEKFIDMPVKHYSSGMFVRLGFAIATKLKADIILLDEVFAVGDIKFQAKCFNAINEMLKNSAVVFVSHSMAQISRICNKVVYLESGKMEHFDSTQEGISRYLNGNIFKFDKVMTGSGKAKIDKISIQNKDGAEIESLNYGDYFSAKITASIDKEVRRPVCVISFIASDMKIVAQCNSFYNKFIFENNEENNTFFMEIPKLVLGPGTYFLTVGVMSENFGEVLVRIDFAKRIVVEGDFYGYSAVQFMCEWSSAYVNTQEN